MHKQEIQDPDTIVSMLKIVARRAELELERIGNEETLEKNNAKLEEKNRQLEILNAALIQKNKEIEDSKEKLLSGYARSLIEASLDPLITISAEGKITDMNEALVTLTGEKRDILRGSHFSQYFTEPDKAHDVYLEAFANNYVSDSPLTLRHKNGSIK